MNKKSLSLVFAMILSIILNLFTGALTVYAGGIILKFMILQWNLNIFILKQIKTIFW